jgi:hypothetical protein
MAGKHDGSVRLLKTLRGRQPEAAAMKIVKAATASTLVFEGDTQALDLDLFEIPTALTPLEAGDRFFTFPLAGDGMRWAVLQRINR